MWEWADPADTRAKLTIVSKHKMASQLMFVLFMEFTSVRNLALSYWAACTPSAIRNRSHRNARQFCTFDPEKEYCGRGFMHSPSRAFGGRVSA
jgi:hypothetical protein